jgi:hypothetical protein
MVSEARLQIATRDRTKVTNCLELNDPYPAKIVIHDDGLEATNYTRPGHPAHPGKIMRIVKQQGDGVVVETTGAGKLRPGDFEAVDLLLIEAVAKKLAPKKPEADTLAKKQENEAVPKKPGIDTLPKKPKIDTLPKKDPVRKKKKP